MSAQAVGGAVVGDGHGFAALQQSGAAHFHAASVWIGGLWLTSQSIVCVARVVAGGSQDKRRGRGCRHGQSGFGECYANDNQYHFYRLLNLFRYDSNINSAVKIYVFASAKSRPVVHAQAGP